MPENKLNSYRFSHSGSGYSDKYRLTYQHGYYASHWKSVEKPLLCRQLQAARDAGCVTVLDFACGTGRIMSAASSVFESICGIDISEEMADKARKLNPKAKILAPLDITLTPLQETFDVITSFRFFLNAEPALRSEVMTQFALMQNPGGVLILNIHVNSSSPLGLFYRTTNMLLGRKRASTAGLSEIKFLLVSHGYKVRSVVFYGYMPRLGNFFPALQEFLVPIVERFSIVLPSFFAQSFMISAERI